MRTIKSICKSMTKNQLINEIDSIKDGCGKRVDSEGDCYYISSRGNRRLCSTCMRQLKIAKEVLSEK